METIEKLTSPYIDLKTVPKWFWISLGTMGVYQCYRAYALNYWARRGIKSPPGKGPLVHQHLFENSYIADLAREQLAELGTDMMGRVLYCSLKAVSDELIY